MALVEELELHRQPVGVGRVQHDLGEDLDRRTVAADAHERHRLAAPDRGVVVLVPLDLLDIEQHLQGCVDEVAQVVARHRVRRLLEGAPEVEAVALGLALLDRHEDGRVDLEAVGVDERRVHDAEQLAEKSDGLSGEPVDLTARALDVQVGLVRRGRVPADVQPRLEVGRQVPVRVQRTTGGLRADRVAERGELQEGRRRIAGLDLDAQPVVVVQLLEPVCQPSAESPPVGLDPLVHASRITHAHHSSSPWNDHVRGDHRHF